MKSDGVSIVIAVWNQLCYTKLAVESILKNAGETPFELVIVDNGSRPDIKAYFDSLKGAADISYIRNEENLGPIRAMNQGLKAARYSYVCVMHNDVIILEYDWLEKIRKVMEGDPKIGIVGLAGRKEVSKAGSINDQTLKHNLQNEDLNAPMEEEAAEVAVVDGLCFVLRREFINRIDGFDEAYGYMHYYDLDISMQSINAGFRNFVARISAMHIANGGMTRKMREYGDIVKDDYGLLKRNCRIFARKWRRLLPIKIS